MFERFTDGARRVVVLAQEEARLLNHDYIGTEHLLLGLIREGDGLAAKALQASGMSLGAVRRQVEEIVGRGQPSAGGTSRSRRKRRQSWRSAWRRRESAASTPSGPTTCCWP